MKRIAILLLLALAFMGCRKGPIHDLFQKKIRIKGQLELSSKRLGNPNQARIGSLTLDDASKVLLFYGTEYDLVEIKEDGTFSGKVPLGSATVLVFLTENNEFIGNLYLKGLNFIPLTALDESINSIDLSTLTLDSTRVVPANDPIGSQIILSQDELDFLIEVGSYYQSLAKNLDMNQDGIVDVLQDKFIEINTSLQGGLGIFGLNQAAPQMIADSNIHYNHEIHMHGPNSLVNNTANSVAQSAIISGPIGNPHLDIQNSGNSYFNDSEFKLNFGRQPAAQTNFRPPFTSGEYVLHFDNKEFPFHFSTLNMDNRAVIIIPTIITNNAGEITGITLEYTYRNGNPANPKRIFISGIDVGFNDNNGQIDESRTPRYDGLPPASYDYYFLELTDPTPLSSIHGITFSYTDIFGNRISNGWLKN